MKLESELQKFLYFVIFRDRHFAKKTLKGSSLVFLVKT